MLLAEKEVIDLTGSRSSIIIHEGGFTVRNLVNEDEKIQAYRLRHRIFCQELKWLSQSEDLLEIDEYDEHAVFFGVFDEQNTLSAFLRLILHQRTFMIEKVFSSLIVPEHKIRKENDTAEISRLCVSPETRNDTISGNFGIQNISMFLYKGVYHWCIGNNIRYLYLVVEHKIYRLCCAKGFPCKLIGRPQTMPDGITAVAAIMDWSEFESSNMEKRPGMLRWFTQHQSVPVQRQLQQHEFCLRH